MDYCTLDIEALGNFVMNRQYIHNVRQLSRCGKVSDMLIVIFVAVQLITSVMGVLFVI